MKPHSTEPHRLTGTKLKIHGKDWEVYGPDPVDRGDGLRFLVGRIGEADRHSWTVDMVELYVLWYAADRPSLGEAPP